MDATPPAWHVAGDQITKETGLAPGNAGLADYWKVPYVIDSGPAKGHRGYVTIPNDDYTPAAVSEAISAEVLMTHGTAGLTSDTATTGV